MPQPTLSEVHVNKPLTDISIAYLQENDNFVADKVFPMVSVSKKSDLYFKYDKSDWFRTEAQERAPGSESQGSGWQNTTDSYLARVYSVHKDIDEQLRANQDSPLDLDRDAARWVAQQLMIKRDRVWASNYFTTGVWDTDLAGVAAAPGAGQFLQWDQAGSTPIENITNEQFAIQGKTGFKPNALVLGAKTFNVLRNHADVVDRVKHTMKATQATVQDAMAAMFDVTRLVVANSVEERAAEGATSDIDYIVGSKAALLAYAAPSPSILQPSAGYTFAWTGLAGAGSFGLRIKRFAMEERASDRVEGDLAFDTKAVSTDLATFFDTAVA